MTKKAQSGVLKKSPDSGLPFPRSKDTGPAGQHRVQAAYAAPGLLYLISPRGGYQACYPANFTENKKGY